MISKLSQSIFLVLILTFFSCGNRSEKQKGLDTVHNSMTMSTDDAPIVLGSNRTAIYLPLLKNKKVGVVGNNTTVIYKLEESSGTEAKKNYTHLVDSLISLGVDVVKVFAPEHGFRGEEPNGAIIPDGIDPKTGLPSISLYKPKASRTSDGDNTKPTPEHLEGVDVLIFDIQDVGSRFYTYISTLHYVMEAAAELDIPVIVLDRPNPTGHYIDGPILEPEHKSFVGMDLIPVVHGLTIGEYAKMLNGEKLLANGIQADLTVIEMENYDHNKRYDPPLPPSPNLPNATAINLYPSLCFFEGTNVNEGRGTSKQFQVFGSPFLDPEVFPYSYVPEPNSASKTPKHNGETCYGRDLSENPRIDEINLDWLIEAYENTSDKTKFFNESKFTRLAGTTKLQEQVESGMSSDEIKETWKDGLEKYAAIREKYLLY
ncbi:DUF1343 domain-containing protein [Gelidibacter japonicus]|uniref:exo-beta-N-acetylmuramidase NamZ family protein n=1 Tax=Gelidibacter japonicus TaxID=1962232 RepID=UPI0020216EFF|nr:DUF1343 domain-containing protein [Gelidibacter japonicus]MCL8008172.1 DUF1343 domain-containing protein [Gelidibacter japonicus]